MRRFGDQSQIPQPLGRLLCILCASFEWHPSEANEGTVVRVFARTSSKSWEIPLFIIISENLPYEIVPYFSTQRKSNIIRAMPSLLTHIFLTWNMKCNVFCIYFRTTLAVYLEPMPVKFKSMFREASGGFLCLGRLSLHTHRREQNMVRRWQYLGWINNSSIETGSH